MSPARLQWQAGNTRTPLLPLRALCLPRATILSSLQLRSLPSLAYLLSNLRATKVTLHILADSGRFDLLYSPSPSGPSV